MINESGYKRAKELSNFTDNHAAGERVTIK